MKVDVHENPALAGHCRVLLDGVDISNSCYAADDETGEAFCYKRDDKGKLIRVRTPHGSDVAKEVRYGKVEIKVGAA